MLIIAIVLAVLFLISIFAIIKLKIQLSHKIELDFKTEQKNREIQQQSDFLANEISDQKNELYLTQSQIKTERINLTNIIQQNKELASNIEDQKSAIDQTISDYYSAQKEATEEKVKNFKREYAEEVEDAVSEYVNHFLSKQQEYQQEISDLEIQITEKTDKLTDLSNQVSAAVEANKRMLEDEIKKDFYRLQISDEDLEEIKSLQEVGKNLRDSEPLNKVIWKVYFEKPYTDLIGRVVGSTQKTGIYKITNIKNNMCYVGQSTDIANRWKQHIKRGLGAETPTRNKLYPAMQAFGVENFSFEIIETCAQNQLNEKEDFWQDHFGAKEYGYSIK